MSTTYRGITVPAGPDDANVPLSFQQFLDSIMPVGEMKMVHDTAAPSGWLLCDGSPIPAGSQYDALRTKLGGTSTPDYRGRMPVMPNGTTIAAIGATGGLPAVGLTNVNQLPAHNHQDPAAGGGLSGIQNTGHFHSLIANGASTIAPFVVYTGPGSAQSSIAIGGSGSVNALGIANLTNDQDRDHRHVLTTQGTGATHENMPPYRAVNFIIKY
jgi:microcystin-dependent protein